MGKYVNFASCTFLLLSSFSKTGGYNVFKGFNVVKPKFVLLRNHKLPCSTTYESSVEEPTEVQKKVMNNKLDRDIFSVALPAFVSLAADPLASLVDAIFVGRLGPVEQAAMGIAISAQFSIAKLYNDPLLKTSTSIVAGKTGDELEAAVATAVYTAIIIGAIQTIIFFFFSGGILNMMGVRSISEMRGPALGYLKYRAFGIPAATMLLVTNSIFRGRGDTITPLYCTSLGTIVNIVLDPFFIFTCQMGCAGAGAATAISQWVTAIPLLYLLNRSVPIKLLGRDQTFFRNACVAYFKAGVLIFLRTIAKISAYTVTSAAAARLGTISMAAYSLTFNLGFATSQLCESISIAAQALLARDYPFDTIRKKESVSHVIRRSLLFGFLISAALSIVTFYNQNGVLTQLTKSPDVFQAAKAVMPVVLMTQLVKGLAYSTGGIILGGLDWFWSSLGMQISAVVCIGLVYLLPPTLWNIWIALGAFMGTQVVVALYRMISDRGPWKGLKIFNHKIDHKIEDYH